MHGGTGNRSARHGLAARMEGTRGGATASGGLRLRPRAHALRGGRHPFAHPGRRLHRRDARHRARRQRRADPRRRPGADHRLSHHRGGDGLAALRRRPRRCRATCSATTRRPASAWCRRWPASTCRPAARLLGRARDRRARGGGRRRRAHALLAARVTAKQEFAGYWEYVLDQAIFTAAGASQLGRHRSDSPRRRTGRHRLAAGRAPARGPRGASQHGGADRSAEAGARRPAQVRPRRTGRRGPGSASIRPRSRTRSWSSASRPRGRRRARN